MENFQVPVIVEWSGQRVLLSAQLAKSYGCSPKNISDNFNRAKEQFTEGVHYFKITGSDLQILRIRYPHLHISTRIRTLYLWTATGIFFHCKMINTPQVWELFSQIGARLSSENHPVLDEIIFDKIKPLEPKPDEAYVYALELDNNLVKIGMSNDVDSRKGSIRRKLFAIAESPSVNDHVRAEELLQIADTMGNTPERKNILIEAANIIAGKKVA